MASQVILTPFFQYRVCLEVSIVNAVLMRVLLTCYCFLPSLPFVVFSLPEEVIAPTQQKLLLPGITTTESNLVASGTVPLWTCSSTSSQVWASNQIDRRFAKMGLEGVMCRSILGTLKPLWVRCLSIPRSTGKEAAFHKCPKRVRELREAADNWFTRRKNTG